MKYNWEIERSLLGGLLLDPTQIPEVDAVLGRNAWHRPQHAALWELILGAATAGTALDLASLMDDIGRRDAFESYGGAAYVATLPNACPTVENLLDYAARVREHADQRSALLSLTAAVERIKQGESLPEIVAELRGALDGVGVVGASPWASMARIVAETADEVLSRRPGVIAGVRTGLRDLDDRLWGLRPGQVTIVAGRPAMGKSAFAGVIARNAGVPVGIVSLEMSRQQWAERWAIAEAGLTASAVRKATYNDTERRDLERAFERLSELQIWIDEAPGQNMRRIASAARRLVRDHDARLLVIDYLGLVSAEDPRSSAYEAITRISGGVKGLAKELGIPIVLLAQLNRALESRTDKRPTCADLRDSGAIEQDANTILMLYRDEVYHPDSADKGLLEVIIAKAREGETGTVKLACDLSRMSIRDLARESWGGGYA